MPEGEYVFQVIVRQPKGVEPSWAVATYHFRVLVLPENDPATRGAVQPGEG